MLNITIPYRKTDHPNTGCEFIKDTNGREFKRSVKKCRDDEEHSLECNCIHPVLTFQQNFMLNAP